MASIISAGTTDSTSLNISSDRTGILQLASNNAVTAVTIDASQNVGVGVTPSAFADKVVQVGSTGALAGSASYGSILSNNIYWSVAGFSTAKYITTGYGSYYYQDQTGKHTWAIVPSGTAGAAATATNAMTLDNNNVLYLPNAPTGDAHVKIQQGGVTTLGAIGSSGLLILGGGSNNQLCQIGLGYTGSYSPTAISSITTTQTGYTIADLIFATRSVNTDTAPTERMRLDSGGNLGVGGSGQSSRITAFSSTVDLFNGWNGSTKEFAVDTSGQIYARFTSISNLSDRRLKENIKPIEYGLADIVKLKPVTFNFIDVPDRLTYGFIAQDVQEVLPELVAEEKDNKFEDGSPYLTLKGNDILPVLVKAMQELKAINDTLTARIEVLENK